MGSFLFRERQREHFSIQQIRKPPPQQQTHVQESGIIRRQRPRQTEVYNPAPIFRRITSSKMTAIEKSPVLYELIHDEHWQIYPALVEHLRIFNVFNCIQVSKAHALTVELYHTVASRCTSKLQQEGHQNEKQRNLDKFKEQRLIIQEYSQIYASLFNIHFLKLRKLIIKGHKNNNQKETIVSLQVFNIQIHLALNNCMQMAIIQQVQNSLKNVIGKDLQLQVLDRQKQQIAATLELFFLVQAIANTSKHLIFNQRRALIGMKLAGFLKWASLLQNKKKCAWIKMISITMQTIRKFQGELNLVQQVKEK